MTALGVGERPPSPRCLNGRELDRQLLARGLEAHDLVRLAGLSPATISRARNGHAVSPPTFRRLVDALASVPVSPLALSLLTDDEGQR